MAATDLLAETPVQIPLADALSRLKGTYWRTESVLKIGQNLKYDMSGTGAARLKLSRRSTIRW